MEYCWEETVEECLNILNNGGNIDGWNDTNLVLIPKTKNPREVGEFRPISLCNVNYKIVTKAIANRMKGCLHSVISKFQSAFIKGKLISDNIIMLLRPTSLTAVRWQPLKST